jgi:hypothetical protein
VTINNQCSDIELTSPIYFIKDATCRVKFTQQVNSESIMNANFVTGIDQDTFGGALLYRLQRREDTSISARLLVIWKYDSNRICSNAFLVELESALDWDKDKLKSLYDIYNNQYNTRPRLGEWLLDDGTKLRTTCETSHGGFKMNVTISKDMLQLQPQGPLKFYPNMQVPTLSMPSPIDINDLRLRFLSILIALSLS